MKLTTMCIVNAEDIRNQLLYSSLSLFAGADVKLEVQPTKIIVTIPVGNLARYILDKRLYMQCDNYDSLIMGCVNRYLTPSQQAYLRGHIESSTGIAVDYLLGGEQITIGINLKDLFPQYSQDVILFGEDS